PTFDMICAADTVGVFQIESRAQMSMLPRLQPRCYYDLVVEVAIVRPGPIQGGMVHPFLRNRSLPDAQIDCTDELKPALMRTKGVPIFQEQVMQIAMLAADFTAGEADQLRRAMAAWKRKGGLGPFHQRLVGRMVEKGYQREYAERIFKQIEGFGEYGFPESHAASFALLVYASAWLKCHHPDAFLAALLNSQPMGFYAPAQLVRDAKSHGVAVLPVDVTCSDWESTLEAGGADPWPVRLGLNRISGLAQESAERLLAARAQAPFDSVEDLARRAALDAGQLALLAQADALARITGHRHQAAWAVAGVDTRATPLLKTTRTHEAAAALAAPGAAEDMLADYRSTGLSLTTHPLALLRAQLAAYRVLPAAALRGCRSGQLARASGLVTHRQRPETAKGVVFVTLEDETGTVNIIVWPDVAEAQRKPLLGSTLLTVYGVWQYEGEGRTDKDGAVMHLIARKLVDHTPLLQGLVTHSRDFR
ncbi:MAG: error-prone DNA polymerase, partial [Burkholderiaceae bacterium]|nr:error-prone DNA polymerase [Burkholderiaceae bacterium]